MLDTLDGLLDEGVMEQRAARAIALVAACEPVRAAAQTASGVWAGYVAAALLVAGAGLTGYIQMRADPTPAVTMAGNAIDVAAAQSLPDDADFVRAVMLNDGSGSTFRSVESVFANDLRKEIEGSSWEGRLTGRLVNSTGGGLSGWTVLIQRKVVRKADSSAEAKEIRTATGPTGQFIIPLEEGRYDISVERTTVGNSFYGFDTVRIQRDEPAPDVLLVLDPGLRIWGRVTDTVGEPVAGARVSADLMYVGPEGLSRGTEDLPKAAQRPVPEGALVAISAYCTTDSAGRYEILTRPRVDRATIYTHATNFLEDGVINVPPYGELNLTLKRKPEIHGQVIDARTGLPLPSFRVAWRPLAAGTEYLGGIAARSLERAKLRTDAEGRFTLYPSASVMHADVLQGTPLYTDAFVYTTDFDVFASAEGYAGATRSVFGAAPDTIVQDVVIRLNRTVRIHGTVRDRLGNPVKGARIQAAGPGAGFHGELVRSDENGVFELDQTEPPMIALTAAAVRFASGWTAVENNKADFVLDEGGSLEVLFEVPNASGRVRLEKRFPGGELQSFATRRSGQTTWSLNRVSTDLAAVVMQWYIPRDGSEGEWTPLDQMYRQSHRLERAVPIRRGETSRVDFGIWPGESGQLSGTISGSDFRDVSVTVTQSLPNGDVLTTLSGVREDGSYRVVGLPPTPYELEIRRRGDSDALEMRQGRPEFGESLDAANRVLR